MKLSRRYVLESEDWEIPEVEISEGKVYKIIYEKKGDYCPIEKKISGRLVSIINNDTLLFDTSEKYNNSNITIAIEDIYCIDLAE